MEANERKTLPLFQHRKRGLAGVRKEPEGVPRTGACQNEGAFAAHLPAILIRSTGHTEHSEGQVRIIQTSYPFDFRSYTIFACSLIRQKFRETELRIRNQLEDKLKDVKLAVTTQQLTELIEDAHRSSGEIVREPSIEDDEYHEGEPQSKYLDDVTDVSEETVISEDAISLTLAKQQYAEELEAEMEDEFNRGLLISKQQYDQLRFEDEKIVALRNAKVSLWVQKDFQMYFYHPLKII